MKRAGRKAAELDVLTIGMVNVDYIAADLEALPAPGVTQFTKERIVERPASGHPANVAIDAVKLGISPKRIGVVAALGKDAAGRASDLELKRYGVNRFIQWAASPTGKNLIQVPRGHDRIFTIDPGANLDLPTKHVRAVLQAHRPRVLSIRPGYSGIDGNVAALLQEVPDAFVLLDLIRPYRKPWNYLRKAIPFVGAIHGNEQEIMGLAGVPKIKGAIRKLHGWGARIILVTRGHKGVLLSTPEHFVTQPGFAVNAVDPTGCGDAFCAGFLVRVLGEDKGRSALANLPKAQLCEMLLYAQAVGAAAACGIGCTVGVNATRVQQLLKAQANTIRG